MLRYISIVYLSHSIHMMYLWLIYRLWDKVSIDHVPLVYNIKIYWRLLVEFSYDLHKMFYNIKLLSMLLTILINSCYDSIS